MIVDLHQAETDKTSYVSSDSDRHTIELSTLAMTGHGQMRILRSLFLQTELVLNIERLRRITDVCNELPTPVPRALGSLAMSAYCFHLFPNCRPSNYCDRSMVEAWLHMASRKRYSNTTPNGPRPKLRHSGIPLNRSHM